MKKLFSMMMVVMGLMVVGCAPAEEVDVPTLENPMTDTIGGYLDGGEHFNVPSEDVFLVNTGDRSTVEVYGEDTEGYDVMARIDLRNGLDLHTMDPGTYEFDSYEPDVFAVGCRGNSRNAWTYDVPAREVHLDVADDGDVRTVDYSLNFAGDEDHLSGVFHINL